MRSHYSRNQALLLFFQAALLIQQLYVAKFPAHHTECKAKELEVDGAGGGKILRRKTVMPSSLLVKESSTPSLFPSCAVDSAAVCGQISSPFHPLQPSWLFPVGFAQKEIPGCLRNPGRKKCIHLYKHFRKNMHSLQGFGFCTQTDIIQKGGS